MPCSKRRYDLLEEAEDLHKAIWAQEMCIACTAADGENLDELYGSLLDSFGARWFLLKDEEDLERILSYAEKAITLNPSNAHAQSILSVALGISYDHHHTLALVDRAILAMQSAVSYSMPHNRMEMLTALAKCYHSRYYHVEDPSDASASIKCLDQAIECGKILSFSEHTMLNDCLVILFDRNDDVQCYERALTICETLLADDSLPNSEQCEVRMMLGNTLLVSGYKGALAPVPCQLGKCIETVERVIKCSSPEHPRCRGYKPYYILSNALKARFQDWYRLQIGTITVDEFEYAISISRKAVKLASEEKEGIKAECLFILSSLLLMYGQVFPSKQNYEQCILLFRQSSQLSSPTSGIRIMSALVEAGLCFYVEDQSSGIDAFTIAMKAVQHRTWLGLSVVQQHRVISGSNTKIYQVGRQAALTAIRRGCSELALELVEQCRSIVWQRVLNLRVSMDALADVEPTLAHRLKEVSGILQRDALLRAARRTVYGIRP